MIEIGDLPTPALLLDLDRLEANLDRMAARARALGVLLRPHLKTHKCVEIARLQQERGAWGVTVATLHEARVFADHGFDDVTWAFPVALSRLEEVRELAARVTLRLVVDSPAAIAGLEARGDPLNVFLKVDCGYHRAGVDPASAEALDLAAAVAGSASLRFDGLLTHSGHAYQAESRERRLQVAHEERDVMVRLAAKLRARGLTVPTVSVGSTPAMAVIDHLEGVDEVRPGNYALYDLTQAALGSCAVADCAATGLSGVVSCPAGSGHAVVDAGALALSKDTGPAAEPGFGRVYADYDAGLLDPELRVLSVSQEHGIVNGRRPVGERLRILPNHSCLTVAQFDEFQVVRGERVVGRWKIWRGRS